MNKLFSIQKTISCYHLGYKYIMYFLGIKFSWKRKIKYLKGKSIVFQIAYNYSLDQAQNMGLSEDEHYNNIKKLKKGLSNDALKNLNRILDRITNIVTRVKQHKSIDDKYIYSEEELKSLKISKDLSNNISYVNNYYQYDKYKLPLKAFSPSVFVYKHGMDTLKTFNNIGDKIILDVGTCLGDSILIFRDYTTNPIIGFEPVQETYNLAIQTLELNKIENAKIENFALGNKNETIEINISPEHLEWASIDGRKTDIKESIICTTLDEYVLKNNLQVGLIKVDIEGFEPKFLEGAINTIKEQKPILLISIYHNYNDFYKIKPWLEDLNLGYKFDFFKGIDGDPVGETLLIGEVY